MNIIEEAKLSLQYLQECGALPEEIAAAQAWIEEVKADVQCDMRRQGAGYYAYRECPAGKNPCLHDATEHHRHS